MAVEAQLPDLLMHTQATLLGLGGPLIFQRTILGVCNYYTVFC
jgi:hypothetical protein